MKSFLANAIALRLARSYFWIVKLYPAVLQHPGGHSLLNKAFKARLAGGDYSKGQSL